MSHTDGGVLEQVDLSTLINWDDQVVCTSRSQHECSKEATHLAACTSPCPDPVGRVFWCLSRYNLHLYLSEPRFHVTCTFCKRMTHTCWAVRPI